MSHKANNIAENIEYVPSTLTDWNGSADPGKVGDGLDQLASRVKTIEGYNNVFGSQYAYSESLTEDSHTGDTNFVQKIRLTTASIPAGTYRISVNYTWRYTGSPDNNFKGQVQIDDTTTIFSHEQEPKDNGADQKFGQSGFKVVALTAGVHNIDLDYGVSNSSRTSYISDAKLEIFRVS